MTCNKNCFFWLGLQWTPESRLPLALLHHWWSLTTFRLLTFHRPTTLSVLHVSGLFIAVVYSRLLLKLLGVLWHKVRQLLLICRRVEDNSSRMICWVVVKHFNMAEVKRETESKNAEPTRIFDMHPAQWNATEAWMCVSSQQSAHRTAVTCTGAHDNRLWDKTLLVAAECSKWCRP